VEAATLWSNSRSVSDFAAGAAAAGFDSSFGGTYSPATMHSTTRIDEAPEEPLAVAQNLLRRQVRQWGRELGSHQKV
jgi:hypothetical protein